MSGVSELCGDEDFLALKTARSYRRAYAALVAVSGCGVNQSVAERERGKHGVLCGFVGRLPCAESHAGDFNSVIQFDDIQSSSEITVESANQIKEIINQQSTAFDQIVATVRQISSGIENFSTSTSMVNNTAQKLKDAANQLESLHVRIISE